MSGLGFNDPKFDNQVSTIVVSALVFLIGWPVCMLAFGGMYHLLGIEGDWFALLAIGVSTVVALLASLLLAFRWWNA